MKCPICDRDMKTDSYNGEHGLEEEHGTCKDDEHFYSYQYTYGNTEECIGNVILHSTYNESEQERKHNNFMRKIIIHYEREWYLKYRCASGVDPIR